MSAKCTKKHQLGRKSLNRLAANASKTELNMIEKLITTNVYAINARRHERQAILRLQSLIPDQSGKEKVSLAMSLIHLYSASVDRELSIEASTVLGQDLTSAILQISVLSPRSALALAIELLELVFKSNHG